MTSLLIKAALMKETKRCSECGRELPLTEFNKKKSNKDGLQDRCRSCFSAYNKRRYEANKEKFKRDVKEYRENNPEACLTTRLKACKKNPTGVNARRCVEYALAAGRLKRPRTCSGCGCDDKDHRIEAHHSDYSKPLNVIWLCTPCHRQMDARRRMREGKEPYGKQVKITTTEQEEACR